MARSAGSASAGGRPTWLASASFGKKTEDGLDFEHGGVTVEEAQALDGHAGWR